MDDSEDIVVNAGDSFIIALESNPTTGFEWMAEIEGDHISYLGKEFVSAHDADTNVVGAGGMEYFTYKAESKGSSDVLFSYARTWESVQPLEKKTFHIIVK